LEARNTTVFEQEKSSKTEMVAINFDQKNKSLALKPITSQPSFSKSNDYQKLNYQINLINKIFNDDLSYRLLPLTSDFSFY
jgi:hypothetical protein